MALAVSAVAASATAVALSSRSDLSASRRRVETAWAQLRPGLDARYRNLQRAADVARARLGAERTVFSDVAGAVAAWPATVAGSTTERQVAAAADLEGLVARLSAMVATTPRLRSAGDVAEALAAVGQTDTGPARAAYNAAVGTYQRARGGFPRRLVAGALGYNERRTLEVPA